MKARPILRITLLTLCLIAVAIVDGCTFFEGGEQKNAQDNGGGGLLDYLPNLRSILIGLGALVLLGGIGYIAKIITGRSRRRADARFRSVMKKQEELTIQTRDHVTGLSQGINTRLAELQGEVKELHRSLRDGNRAILDGVRRSGAPMTTPYSEAYQGYAAPVANVVREEPTFPISVEEYLVKVKRGSIIVKPDFPNGILVQDSDNSGEFMLVRDHLVLDELLYVIPRVSYFQTKQDFYNYYEKYYDCQHPSAGTIWILQPAVVDRVGGGWVLREKGQLDVR